MDLPVNLFLISRLKLKMFSSLKEDLQFLVHKYYETIILAVVSIGVTFFFLKFTCGKVAISYRGHIRGRLGLPFIGETISFLSATNSTKGCYEFVRLRRHWLVILYYMDI